MPTITQVLKARTWNDLGIPKDKPTLRSLQKEFHPDTCKDPKANDAFTALVSLYEGPDFKLRVAEGTRLMDHKISWKTAAGFGDRVSVSRRALERLASLPEQFARFFPTTTGNQLDELVVSYGEGWWFLGDFNPDSRTIVWMAKRLAAAVHEATQLGMAHANINPGTVVINPAEHGLRLDGWWHTVKLGERLALKPEAITPPKYIGGSVADNKIDIAQAAAMLRSIGKPDKVIAEVLSKHALNPGTPPEFFHDIDEASRKLYGKATWHPLGLPSNLMI